MMGHVNHSPIQKGQCCHRANVLLVLMYSRRPITGTFKGNRKKLEPSVVRVIRSSKTIVGNKGKNSFYCTVNILITFNCRNVK